MLSPGISVHLSPRSHPQTPRTSFFLGLDHSFLLDTQQGFLSGKGTGEHMMGTWGHSYSGPEKKQVSSSQMGHGSNSVSHILVNGQLGFGLKGFITLTFLRCSKLKWSNLLGQGFWESSTYGQRKA